MTESTKIKYKDTGLIFENASGNNSIVIDGNSNVGIGVTNPGEKLDVNGDTKIRGNLDIGTSSNSTPTATIRLASDSGDSSMDNCVIERRLYEETEKSELLLFSGNDVDGASGPDRIRLRANQILFDTYDTASYNRTEESIRMTIAGNGNVGIGTTNPETKLTIKTGTNYDGLILTNSTGNLLSKLARSNSDSSVYFALYDGNASAGTKVLLQNNGESYFNGGNVGIGTDDPKVNLQVHQTTAPSIDENNYDNGLVLSYDGGYNEGDRGPGISFAQRWHSGTANSFIKTGAIHGYKGTEDGVFGGGLQFYSINSGGSGLIERMRIDNVGNVGIGTNNPDAKLHVHGENTSNGAATIEITNAVSGTGFMYFQRNNDGKSYVLNGSAHDLILGANNSTSQLVLKSDGNVGIGLTNPAAKLDVVGEVKMGIGHKTHFSYSTNQDAYIRSGQTAGKVVIQDTGGNVGIGTNNPTKGKLHVHGRVANVNIGTHRYYNSNSSNYTNTYSSGRNLSIYCNEHIAAKEFQAFSDERIKENIEEVPDDIALETVRQIECKYYNYKDRVNSYDDKVIGFIAQQVKEVFPMAVSTNSKIIPNVYKSITNIQWEEVTIDNNIKYKMSSSELTDCTNVPYMFYVSDNDDYTDEIEIVIDENDDNFFIFDKKWNYIFCYGYEVDDFHQLEKNKIFALHHSAIQELDRQQQADKAEIAELKTKNQALETKVQTMEQQLADLLARVSALEN